MSLKEPKFGDVFEYRGGRASVRIMWVAPSSNGRFLEDWIGIQVSEGVGWFKGFVGETMDRVPLQDNFYSHWFEVPDVAD